MSGHVSSDKGKYDEHDKVIPYKQSNWHLAQCYSMRTFNIWSTKKVRQCSFKGEHTQKADLGINFNVMLY